MARLEEGWQTTIPSLYLRLAGRLPEAIIVMAGHEFIYTEQDWDAFPGSARAAYGETEAGFLNHWGLLNRSMPNVVIARALPTKVRLIWTNPPSELRACAELARGLTCLRPFCRDLRLD